MIKIPVSEFQNKFEFNPYAIRNDGEFYYVFENKEEFDEFKKTLPEPPKNREVANWKLKAVLHSMGLIGNVSSALNLLEEPTKIIANYAWEYADTINQYSPTTKMIQQACNLTDEQVEEIFTNAEKINI